VALKVFVNGCFGLTNREIVSEFTKKSGILVAGRAFQIQFLASRRTDVYNESLLNNSTIGHSQYHLR